MAHAYHPDTLEHLRGQLAVYERYAANAEARRDSCLYNASHPTEWTVAQRERFTADAAKAEATRQERAARVADFHRILALINIDEYADDRPLGAEAEQPVAGGCGCLEDFRLDVAVDPDAAARADRTLARWDNDPDLVGDLAGPPVDHSALRARATLDGRVNA